MTESTEAGMTHGQQECIDKDGRMGSEKVLWGVTGAVQDMLEGNETCCLTIKPFFLSTNVAQLDLAKVVKWAYDFVVEAFLLADRQWWVPEAGPYLCVAFA
jgi:hypothetical protein